MNQLLSFLTLASVAYATSLGSACTVSRIRDSLPENNYILGVTFGHDSVTANAVYNSSHSDGTFFPDATIDFCNVTFSYTHSGLDQTVIVGYYLPAPGNFKNRFLATGGGAYAIQSGSMSAPGGVMYGAASGFTDGGFGSMDTDFDEVFLLSNGTINWPIVYMFGYQAIKEMTIIGKQLTRNFYDVSNSTKVYSYYQGCSEGGREGWSQGQRAGEEYDGLIIGAPAFRYGQQQANHLYSNIVEKTLDYYPPPCELEKIMNETISACDPLDGRNDGVVSRSDLCQLQFNMSSIIGQSYYCAASTASSLGLGFGKRQAASAEPAQNGTVSAEGVAVAQKIVDGLFDSKGRRGYISYQMGADFNDAQTAYNSTTDEWELSIASSGGEWVSRFLDLKDEDNISTLEGVTYDTLVGWMKEGMTRYMDSLQTTLPDLTTFHENGGKVIHYHGEQDSSIPTGSSVHYYDSVRQTMYPGKSYNASNNELQEWYRLFLVPGAAHCASNSAQPNGPFPQTNFEVMARWVEQGIVPQTLNATVLSGDNKGSNEQICAWHLRPYWKDSGKTLTCEYDQASIDTFTYSFDAYKTPLY
ncbi:Tannase/feruloyl esterase [Penicillium expansum]|uniref:Carboxylic ester hydrolase n=1 Tax=Penicillium expansum TaxID=27334 RepID=A0A0A2JVR6_PENEN|nr:Tannase/feruloyl esterase [Penicillium expansum]KGO59552.1 Tannase/feruloyl esterase [Penicillium expansum]